MKRSTARSRRPVCSYEETLSNILLEAFIMPKSTDKASQLLAGLRRLAQHAGKGLREGMRVARPSRRNVVTIADHKGRPRIIDGIALQAGGLAAVIRIGRGDVLEIFGAGERARHFLLHRHKA